MRLSLVMIYLLTEAGRRIQATLPGAVEERVYNGDYPYRASTIHGTAAEQEAAPAA